MKKFIWKTKGQTLLWLSDKVKKSKVPFLLTFKLCDFRKKT